MANCHLAIHHVLKTLAKAATAFNMVYVQIQLVKCTNIEERGVDVL